MVDLLTPESGLLPAVAYGIRGRRSSLRGKVIPFARGTAWLYRDPRQERSKITDFDVARYSLNVVNDLDAYYEASLWAEVVWRSHASGDHGDEVFRLIDEALTLLDSDPTTAGVLGTVVLWRYLSIMGVQPEPGDIDELYGGVVRFLTAAQQRPTSEILAVGLPEASRLQARRVVIAAIQDAIDVPLKTLAVSGRLRGLGG